MMDEQKQNVEDSPYNEIVFYHTQKKEWSIDDKRRRGWQGMRWLDIVTDSMDMNLSELWETVKDREARHATAHGVTELDTT